MHELSVFSVYEERRGVLISSQPLERTKQNKCCKLAEWLPQSPSTQREQQKRLLFFVVTTTSFLVTRIFLHKDTVFMNKQ